MHSNPYQPQQNYASYDHQSTNTGSSLELQQYGDIPHEKYSQVYTASLQQQQQLPEESANKEPTNTLYIEQKKQLEFASFDERKGFIFKVLSLITIEMATTFSFLILAYYSQEFRNFIINPENNNPTAFLWICLVVSILSQISILCRKNLVRKTPYNYIAFTIFTITFSLAIAGIGAKYYNAFSNASELILLSAGLTFAISSALAGYAWTTKTDFTMMGGALWSLVMVSGIVAICSIFFYNLFWHILVCSSGIMVYGLYLVYDIQLMIGGKKYELTIDDYLFGSIVIYLDIIMLFLRILEILIQIFGQRK